MKVFISWSGEASRRIAAKLYEWLPMVLQSVQPYMSAESIDKGVRWSNSISGELEGTDIGIVILTADNLSAPWIYFEAGAIAKVVGESRLAPLLCGLKPSDIGAPLSQFQVTVFSEQDVLKLLKSINACAADDALPENRLEKMHSHLWPDLWGDVEPIIKEASDGLKVPDAKSKSEESGRILEELLVLTRQQAHAILSMERAPSRELVGMIIDVVSDMGVISDVRTLRRPVRELYRRWNVLQELMIQSIGHGDAEGDKKLMLLASRVDVMIKEIIELSERGIRRGSGFYEKLSGGEVVNAFAKVGKSSGDSPDVA